MTPCSFDWRAQSVPAQVIQLPRRKTSDAVAAYDGPSPLAAMLDNLRHWHSLATSLDGDDPESAILARFARVQSQKCACDAAPFMHPRLAATISDVSVEHHYTPLPPSPISRLSDEAAERLLARIEAGELTISEAVDGLE
jgi:hypothetical protein